MSEHIPSQKLAFHAKIAKAGFPMVNSIPPKYRYDAFISYSRRDKAFAKALETALENFRPPKGLPVRMQNLDIFRDESDLTGTAYHESIELHLQQSAKLILICSPDAARSEYVADEIRRFVGSDASRGHQIIPILSRGIPNKRNRKRFRRFCTNTLKCLSALIIWSSILQSTNRIGPLTLIPGTLFWPISAMSAGEKLKSERGEDKLEEESCRWESSARSSLRCRQR